jgi:hypothetical protein
MKPIEIQISAEIQAPRNGRRIPAEIIREAIKRRANGEIVPGIDLRIISWRHGNAGPRHEAENSDAEWQRFARFLQGASISVITR